MAEAQPVARAGGDRQHVLDRAADFDAGHVVADVGAQRVAAQPLGDRCGQIGVGGRDAEGRRQPARDFLGEARTGDHADRRRPHRRDDAMRQRDARRLGRGDEAFASQASGAFVARAAACTTPVSAPIGVATMISEAPAIARDSSATTSISGEIAMPGR